MGSRGFQLSSANRRRLYKTKKKIHLDGLSSGLTSGDLRFNGNYMKAFKLLIICNSFRSRLEICKSTGRFASVHRPCKLIGFSFDICCEIVEILLPTNWILLFKWVFAALEVVWIPTINCSLNLNLNSVALVPCVCFHYCYYTIQGAISIVYVCRTSESLVNPVVLSLSPAPSTIFLVLLVQVLLGAVVSSAPYHLIKHVTQRTFRITEFFITHLGKFHQYAVYRKFGKCL